MIKTALIKSASKKINGFVFELDSEAKTFSIGYRKRSYYSQKLKVTKKQFDELIAECYKRGYSYKDKKWI